MGLSSAVVAWTRSAVSTVSRKRFIAAESISGGLEAEFLGKGAVVVSTVFLRSPSPSK